MVMVMIVVMVVVLLDLCLDFVFLFYDFLLLVEHAARLADMQLVADPLSLVLDQVLLFDVWARVHNDVLVFGGVEALHGL